MLSGQSRLYKPFGNITRRFQYSFIKSKRTDDSQPCWVSPPPSNQYATTHNLPQTMTPLITAIPRGNFVGRRYHVPIFKSQLATTANG